jgi:hypothetical protein
MAHVLVYATPAFEQENLSEKEAEAIRQHGVELRPMVRGVVDAKG